MLDRFLPYGHYDKQWQRPSGTTEDGIEQQKLMCMAITAKMPFTCSKLTLNQTVDGMYKVLTNKIARIRKHIDLMESQLPAI